MVISQKSNSKLKTLDLFREVNNTFPKTAQILEYKRQGKKVFGWLCTYVPEEVIHAAGALPIRITGYSEEVELEDGDAYLYVNNCSFSRSCLQLGLKGGYDFLDGIVAGSTCDGARRLFDIWNYYIKAPFYHMITVPESTLRLHTTYIINRSWDLNSILRNFSVSRLLTKHLLNLWSCIMSQEHCLKSFTNYES